MATFSRRNCMSACASSAVTLSSSSQTSPDVGSINLRRQRISVDFPLPERPMMTHISPRLTEKLTSRTAGTAPASSPSDNAPASWTSTVLPSGVYTFHRFFTCNCAVTYIPPLLDCRFYFLCYVFRHPIGPHVLVFFQEPFGCLVEVAVSVFFEVFYDIVCFFQCRYIVFQKWYKFGRSEERRVGQVCGGRWWVG